MLVVYKMENKLITTSSTLYIVEYAIVMLLPLKKVELVPLVVKGVVLCLVCYATSSVCS